MKHVTSKSSNNNSCHWYVSEMSGNWQILGISIYQFGQGIFSNLSWQSWKARKYWMLAFEYALWAQLFVAKPHFLPAYYSSSRRAQIRHPGSWILGLVLAMVASYMAAVRVWNCTEAPVHETYLDHMPNHRVGGNVGTGPLFHLAGSTTCTQVRNFNSHSIATWSIREMCSLMSPFNCCSPNKDQINIR
jgi:hypothetical protein